MQQKEFKTIEEQLAILKSRGLNIIDEEVFKNFLLNNNYYRVSGYTLSLRMKSIKNFANILFKYEGVAKEILVALLDKYMNEGIYDIENLNILKLDPFLKYGNQVKIASFFGGKEGYIEAVRELENEIYKAA